MATLTDSADGHTLEIVLLDEGPRHPVNPDMDFWWLNLKVTVRTTARSWDSSGEILTAGELFRLADQVMAWSELPAAEDEWMFTEPNLTVRKRASSGARTHLEFGFDYETHPDHPREAGDPHWVVFDVEPSALTRFGSDLMESIKNLIPGIARVPNRRKKTDGADR